MDKAFRNHFDISLVNTSVKLHEKGLRENAEVLMRNANSKDIGLPLEYVIVLHYYFSKIENQEAEVECIFTVSEEYLSSDRSEKINILSADRNSIFVGLDWTDYNIVSGIPLKMKIKHIVEGLDTRFATPYFGSRLDPEEKDKFRREYEDFKKSGALHDDLKRLDYELNIKPKLPLLESVESSDGNVDLSFFETYKKENLKKYKKYATAILLHQRGKLWEEYYTKSVL